VLEINAGDIAKYNIEIGDSATHDILSKKTAATVNADHIPTDAEAGGGDAIEEAVDDKDLSELDNDETIINRN
jgi:hypothetical protein